MQRIRFTGDYNAQKTSFGLYPPFRVFKQDDLWICLNDSGTVVFVNLLCPCGCGSECYTPCNDATKGEAKHPHHWLYAPGPSGKVTIVPSIRYRGGCKAHFNITEGRAVFHADSGK